jgi:hypothetical protein
VQGGHLEQSSAALESSHHDLLSRASNDALTSWLCLHQVSAGPSMIITWT